VHVSGSIIRWCDEHSTYYYYYYCFVRIDERRSLHAGEHDIDR
jgi:hypothetical protein